MTSFATSRIRLIALLIVAAFSISTFAVATAYVASPAAAAKKKKKCKKGYKKVKGKCKKVKKKATSPALTVTSVKLDIVTGNKSQVKVNGLVTTNVASRDTIKGEIAVTVAGATQKFPVTFALRGPSTQFNKIVNTTFANTDDGTVTVTAAGKASEPKIIK